MAEGTLPGWRARERVKGAMAYAMRQVIAAEFDGLEQLRHLHATLEQGR
jgi:hypothetical protein